MNEDLSSFSFHQRAQAFSHAPTNVTENLQTVGTGYQKCETVVAQDTNRFGKALKGLQVKAGEVELLELFFSKHSAVSGSMLHLVAAQILIIQTFQPLTQIVGRDTVSRRAGHLGGLENLILNVNGAIQAQSQRQRV